MGEGTKKRKQILSTIILTLHKAKPKLWEQFGFSKTLRLYTGKHARVKNICIVYQQINL